MGTVVLVISQTLNLYLKMLKSTYNAMKTFDTCCCNDILTFISSMKQIYYIY